MINNRDRFAAWPPAGFDGIFHWDFLLPGGLTREGAFRGTAISPMDFDAAVERFRSFLVYETKVPGTSMPLGQRRTLESLMTLGTHECCLHQDGGPFTIIYLEGKTPQTITRADLWLPNGEKVVAPNLTPPAGVRRVFEYSRDWFARVDSAGLIHRAQARDDFNLLMQENQLLRQRIAGLQDALRRQTWQDTFQGLYEENAANELSRMRRSRPHDPLAPPRARQLREGTHEPPDHRTRRDR